MWGAQGALQTGPGKWAQREVPRGVGCCRRQERPSGGSGRCPQMPPVGWGDAEPCPPTDSNVYYHVEGSRQALRVVLHLDSYHFSKLPARLEAGASLRLHTVLFTKGEPGCGLGGGAPAGCTRSQPTPLPPAALENVEGLPPPGSAGPAADLQQEINAQSLEKVQQYYRKLRCVGGSRWGGA